MGNFYSKGTSEGLGQWWNLVAQQLDSRGPTGRADWVAANGGGSAGSSGGSSGSSGGAAPSPGSGGAASSGPSFRWSFPQYSQTWAFTPPAPSAFRLPPGFDPKTPTGYTKSYSDSLAALMAKYK